MRHAITLAFLLAAISAPALPGCAGPYDQAIDDMDRPEAERLSDRLEEMVESAEHALESLEHAYESHNPMSAPGTGDESHLITAHRNSAESAAFEFHRRGLSVLDLATDEQARRLRPAMDAMDASLQRGIDAFRARPQNVDTMRDAVERIRIDLRRLEDAAEATLNQR